MKVPISPDDDVAALATRARAGDPAAFEEIVGLYQADMARLCFAVSGDLELARDAAQSAWGIAWSRLDQLRDPAALRSWLLAIAANEARRALRRDRLRRLAHRQLASREPPASPERDVDLERALGKLGTADRELLGLRFGLGLDSAAIAGQLGIGRSAVRMRLHRLLRRLRTELER